MNLKTRRAINFWWGLGFILLIAVVCVAVFLIFKKQDWVLYFIISLVLDCGIFFGFYIVFTTFKNNKYPYLTFVPEYAPTDNIFKKMLCVKFIWIWLLPIISAMVVPLFFIIFQAVKLKQDFDYKIIIVYIAIILFMLINNLAYTLYISKKINDTSESNDFSMKLD